VDGWLARRAGTASRFGARYDVEVDALLMLALAIMAWRHAKAGPWVLLTGLLLYLFVWAGWICAWMGAPLSPTLRGRVICVVAAPIPIRTFIDYGEPLGTDRMSLTVFRNYQAVRDHGAHLQPKPGERLPLKDVDVDIVSGGGYRAPI